ncbi:MAG: endonuclease/exonuclease/phosphatase family protein [Sedimenticola sp.]
MKRSLCYPEFVDLLCSYDIFCILETNMSPHGIVDVKGYTFHSKCRNTLSPKRSGGIGIYIKDDILGSTVVLQNTCEYILWLKIKHDILNLDSDILLGAIYLPPTGSRYLDEDQMILLDEEIAQHCTNYKFSILLGDVNARTACLPDYIVSDDFLSSHFDFDTELFL